MITIENIPVGGNDDHRLVLRNAAAAQKLSIGTSWTTLRIGCRIAFEDVGGDLAGQPQFFLGVTMNPTAGVANGPLWSATPHFVGMRTNILRWIRDISPTRYSLSTGAGSINFVKFVDGVVSSSDLSTTYRFSLDTATRWPLMVEITKGAPNYTLQCLVSNGVGYGDVSEAVLVNAMDAATLAAAETTIEASVPTSVAVSLSTTLAVDEAADGDLDSICIAWNMSHPPCYVSELLFYKVA